MAGTYANLDEVGAIDGDSLFAGGGCVARRSDDAGRTFKRVAFSQTDTKCSEPLAAGWFVSEQTGYLVLRDGTVLRTDNDGDTFSQRTPLPGTEQTGGGAVPSDVVFTSDLVGFGATSEGRLFRTTDGANSWTEVAAPGRPISEITFLDANTGFAVGAAQQAAPPLPGLLLATTDGGQTWTPRPLAGSPPLDLASVRAASPEMLVMTTTRGSEILRSSDGGATASLVTPTGEPLRAVAFASPTRLVAAGQSGSMAISDDAGLTFAPVGGRMPGSYTTLRGGLQRGTAFAAGNGGALARTVDGGRTWARANVSTSEDLRDVSFVDANTGYALDTAGDLWATHDGGATWASLDTGTTAPLEAVLAVDRNTVLLMPRIGLRRSSDGGQDFEGIRAKGVAGHRFRAFDRAGSRIVAYSGRAVMTSATKGRTWQRAPLPHLASSELIDRLDFVDRRVAYAWTTHGRMLRTANAGRTWTRVLGIGAANVAGVAFSTPRKGYAIADALGDLPHAGFLLRTIDAGRTWAPQLIVAAPIDANGLVAGPGGTDYLLSGTGNLLFTNSGGLPGRPSRLTITVNKTHLARPGKIALNGRLFPAGRASVIVSALTARGWVTQSARVASNGRFTTSWRVRRGTTTFVAQWPGDFRSQGDGTPPLSVTVSRHH